MSTTNPLTLDDINQKIEQVLRAVNSIEAYVKAQDARMGRMEQRLYDPDKNLDAHLRDVLHVKDRVRELEEQRTPQN
ncbi:MAG TPA: hypothetical protein VFD58_05020 [Blastocatellia bacterium]|nr:hypothetical protein [Blastocatellia bacterium]